MSGTFSPLKVIINPPGMQSGMPGEIVELHVVAINQGTQNAIIDIFLDEAFQIFSGLSISPCERVALAPQQSIEVSFQVPIPIDILPGTYDYAVIVDAPQHYPADTPIQFPQQIKVLLAEQTIVREYDPTFALQPTSNPKQPLIYQAGNPLQVGITVNNRSSRVDSFRLSCADLEEDWLTIEYPAIGADAGLRSGATRLELNPNAVGQIWLKFHPPVDVLAGNYSFTLRLHSENSPNLTMLDLVYVQIPPVYRLGIKPNTILGKVNRSDGQYELEIANLGNTVRQLAFSAKTQTETEICAYKFTPDRLRLLPAKNTVIQLTVRPNNWWQQPWIGAGLFINFQVDCQDIDKFPLTEIIPPQTLVWQPRPWWQLLLLLLVILGALGSLGTIGWMLFRPNSLRLEKFSPESRKLGEGDRVLLNWEIHDFQQMQSLKLAIKGPVPSERELKLTDLISEKENTEAPCTQQNRVLTCRNFTTEAKEPGKYTFEIKVLDRDSKVLATQATDEVEITAKPEPEFKEVKPDKSTYTRGEKPLLTWTIKYPDKLEAVKIVVKTEDGKIASEQTIDRAKIDKDTNCKTETKTVQLTCNGFPLELSQAGKYQLEIITVSKSKKVPTAPQLVKIEVLPKQLKIVSFTLNNSETESIVVKEGENLNLNWQVDGEENIQVELNPFGTVQKSGTKQIPVTPAIPAQISLTATDKYGQKVTKGFAIKVEANTSPSTTPSTPNPIESTPTTPESNPQKPKPKPSGDLSI
jgi:hypothetical protein